MRSPSLILRISLLTSFSTFARNLLAGDPCSHFDSLPHEHGCLVGPMTPGTELSAVPGEPPSASHPRGTILLAWSALGLGVTLTEWDLAAARRVRQTPLGLPTSNVFAVRTGDEVSVMSTSGRKLTWTLVDAHRLQVLRKVPVALAADWPRVASDRELTVIAWEDLGDWREPGQRLWKVATYDNGGHALGSWTARNIQSQRPFGLAVLNGAAYIATNEEQQPIIKLSANAIPIAHTALVRDLGDEAILAYGGRLFVAFQKELVELSPDLQVLNRRRLEEAFSGFDIAKDGQILVGTGQIFSPTLQREGELQSLSWLRTILWVGDTPVTVSQYLEPYRVVLINWKDPDSFGTP